MQLFAEKGDFSNKKRPKRDPQSGLGLLRDPGPPKRDPIGSSDIVFLGKCMMSVKDIVGSLVITILPHLGDIMPSGGGLSGRVFFQRGYLA